MTETPHYSVLQEAEKIINGQRRVDYGGAYESFDRIAKLWEPILGVRITAHQVALCMIQLKVARAVNNLAVSRVVHRDSIVDIAGYAGCLEKIQREATEREEEQHVEVPLGEVALE